MRLSRQSISPDPAPGTSRIRRMLWTASFALSITAIHAVAQTLTSSVIAAGGGTSASAGGCLKLNATLGQPAPGPSSGGTFALNAGYWAGRGDRDSLFHQGFEVCS
jgi:hypothetical protein